MKIRIRATLFLIFCLLFIVISPASAAENKVNSKTPMSEARIDYQFPWPGILPDHPLYKLKVARNKLIYKIIYNPMKRVEFDLLMADKTLYASKLLLEKGQGELAKETALKGENYFSVLVSDYGTVLAKKQKLPFNLYQKIDKAYQAHQQLIKYLRENATEEDKATYDQVDYFSKSNYQSFLELQKQKKE